MALSNPESEWGWMSYKRLGWHDGKGHKLYEGKFRQDHDLNEWTLQIVRFLASKPGKAMSFIVHSGKEPIEFAHKIIN